MSTEATIDYNSLSWVKKQLDSILAEAQSALSEYIENQDDDSSLQKCVSELKLVYGTLQMVEVYGAAMLADEMLQTASAQLAGKIERPEDAFDVLMRAMLQLPDYLESVQSGNKDAPIALLPLMNDLRTARGENLLSESVLFLPDIEDVDMGLEEADIPEQSGTLQAQARRLRIHYQVGLLDFLKNRKASAALQRMAAVLSRLEQATAEHSVRKLWMVIAALIEALQQEGLDANISIKMLLGHVDRQIKQLLDEGEESFAERYSQDLLKNLLYYIGRSSSRGDRVERVRQAYELDELLPSEADIAASGSGMAGLNSELFDTVSQGIREDLTQVKDALELFVHSAEQNVKQLAPLAEQLMRIGDTYGMLGLGVAREIILDQRNSIESILSGELEASEGVLMEIAGSLLKAESELDNFVAERAGLSDTGTLVADSNIPAAEYRQVLDTVITEGLKNFTDAKDAVLAFTTGIGDREQLDIIMQKLEEVKGVVTMLPMKSIEAQLNHLMEYVQTALIDNRREPDEAEQDTIADVVTSIEYYFEAMTEGRPGVELGLKTGNAAAEKLSLVTRSYVDSVTPSLSLAAGNDAAAEREDDEQDKKADSQQDDEAAETTLSLTQADVHQPAASAAPDTSEYEQYDILGDDPDEEILEIFIEEAVEVLEEMHANLPLWIANREDEESLTTVRRSFHTLKGSGRLVGAQLIGEFSWKFENMLNRVIEKKIEASDVLVSKVEEALSVLPQLIEQLKGNREPVENIYELMAAADALSEGREIARSVPAMPDEPGQHDAPAEVTPASADDSPGNDDELHIALSDIDILDESRSDTSSLAEWQQQQSLTDGESVFESASDSELETEEPARDENASSREESNADATDEAVALAEAVEDALLDDTLGDNDGNEPVGVLEGDELSFSVEDIKTGKSEPDDSEEAVINLTASSDDVEDDFDQLSSGMASLVEDSDDDVLSGRIGVDPVLFKIYHEESLGHIEGVRCMLAEHKSGEKLLLADKDLIRAMHTLYGSARTAGIDSIASLCGAAEKYVKARNESVDNTVPEQAVLAIEEVIAAVSDMLALVKQGTMPQADKVLQDRLNRLVQDELQQQLQRVSGKDRDNAQSVTDEPGSKLDEEIDIASGELAAQNPQMHEETEEKTADSLQMDTADKPAVGSAAAVDYGEIDNDLIDIFLEEAEELIERCESSLLKLRDNSDDDSEINQLQRYMHTLKGGARMADLTPVSNLTHALESLVVKWSEKAISADPVLFDHLNEALDALNGMLENVKSRSPIQDAAMLVERLKVLMQGGIPEQRAVERFDVDLDELKAVDDDELDDEPDMPVVIRGRRASDIPEEIELAQASPRWGERATDGGQDTREQVRVRADLLNDLVNYAGEVNIYHARMGKQVADFSFNLSELDSTVVRLKEQLRKLEIETEIQIRSSYEKERENDHYDADFDPLEMDRYSTIQQLSRSLAETAGDVESIKQILQDITRDSETLLLQESRVSTELQEGLMRTRMVRFGGLGTRLRRIVRQTARELNKEVELQIIGDSNEVDRTVLDRIIAPLEHMLRNAVAHGIELPAQRRKAGKPETGRIIIKVDRQGADVVIKVSDDGAGIDADAIRAKAIGQGLIEADSKLTDHDVLQLILKSGFSTAESVSQIAGRGVGMDVVDSEIKQLGGLLEIDTRKGRGTDFTIRLPLTLAINQALLVHAGEDIYAVPLASIEGVVRITGNELQRFYDSGQSKYEFNGVEFELKHLGYLLTGNQPDYSKQHRLFPVLLARVGDQHYALHVDDLVGRREIVVKPVGLQIGTVRGIAGATILADGRVVMILEMSALVVSEAIFRQPQEQEIEQPKPVEEKKVTTVMVVDDSITIRKVTARMLERHGINVIAAKDGVDATNQLQDHVPDLMLLDIEMPRMDGFELATYIRNDERLKDLPIIMITSRTGSKHKEKAMEIGVNQYLGKPYQEDELMKNIAELIGVA